jgi:5'-nucleotidase (lipoprotein e(P4) family)
VVSVQNTPPPPAHPGVVAREEPPADDTLYATVWMQTAGEFAALSRQAYRAATLALEEALADPTWTAATEQEGRAFSHLPPAIIVDVDETVLDNSAFQAQLILDRQRYTEEAWEVWVERAEAVPMAGAAEFLKAAAARGVTVFYVTNRDAGGKAATAANLRAHGFPLAADRDVLLCKGERGWTSDKQPRRELIAEDFRILMLCGDDLNDFVAGTRTDDPDSRRAAVAPYADWFGSRWIVLPNPVYGSWEASLFGRDYSLDPEERRARVQGHLRPFR